MIIPPTHRRQKSGPPAFYNDLDRSLDEAWRMLFQGGIDRLAPFHTLQIATIGNDGFPQARTVVLRGCDPIGRRLRIHTDRRAGKTAELQTDPRASIHAYAPDRKIQVRLQCRVSVHLDGPLWEKSWAETRDFSRECYRVVDASAAPLAAPEQAVFDPGQTNNGADNFAVLLAEVSCLEWLYLAAAGHRRAKFEWDEAGWHGTWLVP